MDIEESTVASLQAKVLELEEKRDELLSAIEAKENEFGLKRAQFKELFLQRESKHRNLYCFLFEYFAILRTCYYVHAGWLGNSFNRDIFIFNLSK